MKFTTQKGDSNETKDNPWKGLVPYQDGDKCLFCGRERETEELSEIVRQNTIVTLYGRSGVGKTSLLQAGIFPIMKFFGYKPISIRLSTERKTGESLTDCIIRIIKGFYKSNPESSSNQMKLRDFLDSIECGDDNKPLIILDQFEEVLRDAKDDATLLLKELRALLSKNGPTHLRVIISLREDDLYRLEDLLDRNHIDKLNRTRYRIRDIDFEGSLKIIKYPAQKAGLTIEDDVVKALIEKIQNDDNDTTKTVDTDKSRRNEISTLLLSLYLNRLYNNTRNTKTITKSDIGSLGKRPLYNYYSDATKGLSLRKKTQIAKMAPGGYRLPKSESELKAILGSKFDELTKGDNRIFNIASGSNSNNDERKWELVHDRLAKNIYDTLSERRVRRNKTITTFFAAAFIVGIAMASLVLGINRNATKPIPFRTEDYIGKTVEWQGRPFEIKNGHLKLTKCTVEPYTFIDVIDTLTLGDSVELKGNAIETSRLRHINIYGKFHGLFFDQGNFDSLKSINIGPNASPYYVVSNMTPHCTDIQSVTIAPGNHSFIYSDGTLWFNVNGLRPVISRNKTVLCEDIYQSDSKKYTRIDIARDEEKMQNSKKNNYIFLTCSDSTKKHISAKDIPAGTIVGIDMPWVTEIDANVLRDNCTSCQKISLPKLKELGGSNFDWEMNELDSLTLPDSIHITSIYRYNPFYSGEGRTERLLKGTTFTYNDDTTSYCIGKYGTMKKYPNTRAAETNQPDDTCGYHIDANNKIVFDSDIVSLYNINNIIDYDSLTIIPSIVHFNNHYYKVENKTLMYRQENAFRPALILRSDEPVLIHFKDNLHEKAFGATSYELYWPIRYNIPSGDTLYVPYGQTDLYKRLYGNGYTFKELSRRKTRRNAEIIRNKALDEGGKLKDRTLTIGAHTKRVGDEYTDNTFFDRPIVTDIDIDWCNTTFSTHGNVLYRNEHPIRSINNGKTVVLNGLSSLGNKKIHKGEYVLLQADALFPEPSLYDSASLYTFFVPKGSTGDYHLLAEQGCRIKELPFLQTFQYRFAEWWNKHILIAARDGNPWIVHKKVILAWTIYIIIILASTIISSIIMKKKTDLQRGFRALAIALMALAAAIIALTTFFLLTKTHFSAYISTALYLALLFSAAAIWRHKAGCGKRRLAHTATILMMVALLGSLCSCSKNADTKPSRIYPDIKGNRLGFVDANGKTVVPYQYPTYFQTDAHGDYIITDYASFSFGIIDSTGKTLVPCRFEDLHSAFIIARNGTYYSILSSSATKQLWLVYNSDHRMILSHSSQPVAVENKDGLFFRIVPEYGDTIYYDTAGVVTAAPEGAKVINYDIKRIPHKAIPQCSLTITKQDETYGVADSSGNTIIPCIYDKIEWMYTGSTGLFHLYKDGKQGVADTLGRIIYPLKKGIDIESVGSCFYVHPIGHTTWEFRTSLYDSRGKRILKNVKLTYYFGGSGLVLSQRKVRLGTRYYIIGNDGKVIVGRCRIAYYYNSGGEEIVEFRKHGHTGRLVKNNNNEWEPRWYK